MARGCLRPARLGCDSRERVAESRHAAADTDALGRGRERRRGEPPRGRSRDAVFRTAHARTQARKAVRVLAAPDETEPLRRQWPEHRRRRRRMIRFLLLLLRVPLGDRVLTEPLRRDLDLGMRVMILCRCPGLVPHRRVRLRVGRRRRRPGVAEGPARLGPSVRRLEPRQRRQFETDGRFDFGFGPEWGQVDLHALTAVRLVRFNNDRNGWW